MVQLGRAYLYSKPDSCTYYFERAMATAVQFQYEYGTAVASVNLGDYHNFYGNYPEALGHYMKGLGIFERLGKASQVATCHNNLGLLYMAIGANTDAREHLEFAIDYFVANNKTEHEYNVLNNLGMIFVKEGKYEEGERRYRRSLQLRQELGAYKGSVLHNLGELMALRGMHDSAMVYLEAALEEKTLAKRESSKVTTYDEIGKSKLALGDQQGALEAFRRGFEIGDGVDMSVEMALVCADLAQLEAATGDYKSAYEHEHSGRVIRDSLYNPEMLQQLSKLEVDRVLSTQALENQDLVHKKQLAEAQLLNSRWLTGISLGVLGVVIGLLIWIFRLNVRKGEINRDLNLLNQELEQRVQQRTASLRSKTEVLERHAFDLSHRVRGPVASILGLSNLLAGAQPEDPEFQRYLEGIRQKAQSLDAELRRINEDLE